MQFVLVKFSHTWFTSKFYYKFSFNLVLVLITFQFVPKILCGFLVLALFSKIFKITSNVTEIVNEK